MANEHNTLGASFFESGATELAVEQFRIAVSINPTDAVYWKNLGAALLENGSVKEAEEALIKSIGIDPNNQHAHYHFAQLLRGRGDRKAAAREFQLAIEIDPTTHLAERARQLRDGWKPKITLGMTVLLVLLLVSCSTNEPRTKVPELVSKSETQTSECDPGLWKYVYNPSRLEVIEQCKQVSGTIAELDQNADGDTHMLLTLDPGQEDLLKKKNKSKKDGNLVIEVVCSAPITEKKVGDTCSGFANHVTIPKVGDHVTVTGSYVNDTHNGWAEIHPVSSIEAQK